MTSEGRWHRKTVNLSSHMCDMTRHDRMRHYRTENQDMTIFKFGATHATTRPMRLDNDLLQTP